MPERGGCENKHPDLILLLPFVFLPLAKPNKTPEGRGAHYYVHLGGNVLQPKPPETAVIEQLGLLLIVEQERSPHRFLKSLSKGTLERAYF